MQDVLFAQGRQEDAYTDEYPVFDVYLSSILDKSHAVSYPT